MPSIGKSRYGVPWIRLWIQRKWVCFSWLSVSYEGLL